MFKRYKDICDVVSLLAYCPSEKSYLLFKETSGEFWIPCCKSEKSCWKMTAHKLNFELFGLDAVSSCVPIRIYKVWLPGHDLSCACHIVYKVAVKSDVKKRTKMRVGIRSRLQWFTTTDLERQRAHSNLRSPEVSTFAQMAIGDVPFKDPENLDMETSLLIELCEENIIIGSEVAGGAVGLASPNNQLLQAASYNKEDQIRLYREYVTMVYPAMYMSPNVFTQFMLDLGWQRGQCNNLFRAADITGRGGLSFTELMLWTAALEPGTQHTGIPAEIRCRYIFRYFDSNRDAKLEYVELKELVAAARAARQLPVDSLSVARDTDVCLRQLGMQPSAQLPLSEFLRGVGEQRLRGTSSLLRAPRSIAGYVADLQSKDSDGILATKSTTPFREAQQHAVHMSSASSSRHAPPAPQDYRLAVYTTRLHKNSANEMIELKHFDDDAVSPSTTRLLPQVKVSLEVLAATSAPAEALLAVRYFASAAEKHSRPSMGGAGAGAGAGAGKPAFAWGSAAEEEAMGARLLWLAEAVRPVCAKEPRLVRLSSPVYAIGDLHGNLEAILTIESNLWPTGACLSPARILFLGDYVDRGPHGTELMAYLFAAKLQRPSGLVLIRGNHETRDIQKMFTFHNECITKYGDTEGPRIWNAINQVFDVLPLAAVVDEKIFCCHGGIPPPWVCPLISAIDKVPVPLTRPAEQSSIAWELLWNDPIKPNKLTATLALELAANEGFAANVKRGTGHVFDQTALDRFLLANQLSHVVRAHEVYQNGFMCHLRGRLVSVFSSTHYCGSTNDSCVALLDGGKIRLIRVNTE